MIIIITLATYPTPAQTRGANSLGHFIKGAMTERGLHMSADGSRDTRRTLVTGQGLDKSD
eukprot:8475218-Pyramimonas_sp.AAC.1